MTTTLYVRSPERLLGNCYSRAAIDVWAFGVQLWCLRSGTCEWVGDDPPSSFVWIVNIDTP